MLLNLETKPMCKVPKARVLIATTLFCGLTSGMANPLSQLSLQEETPTDTLFVYLKDGGFDAFPLNLVASQNVEEGTLRVQTVDGSEFTYQSSQIASYGLEGPNVPPPSLTSFKYNSKYNDQVHSDAEATIDDDSLINISVGAIGRWLTPTFKISEKDAGLYRGTELLTTNVSRHPVADGEVYTVARPGERVFSRIVVSPPVWGDPEGDYIFTQIPLSADMLSTNAPSNYEYNEGLDKIVDGDPNTYFHSTWGEGPYEKLPLDSCPYIDVRLDQTVDFIRFAYQTRADQDRMPTAWEILASTDGEQWNSCMVLTTDDGLPTTPGAAYTSPVIDLQGSCTYLRFKMLESTYKNYLCLAELYLDKATPNENPGESTLIDPGEEDFVMMPYGRTYRMNLEWLADNHQVPRIDINTEDGQMISSKVDYKKATIKIDGGGVFPDFDEMAVQIRGRGNSSWDNNPWAKNPYRLKFDKKQSIMGLAKGKNWVLQANKQNNSMMANAVGMKIARLVGTAAANHVVPVELYINGNYRGSYIITEKVGFSGNSIDLDDESAAVLIELDTYFDEDYKFRTNYYDLPANIKEPDFSEGETTLTLEDIKSDLNNFTHEVYLRHDISDIVDATMLGRYLMVNELIDNYEIQHPKSTYLYRENLYDPNSKWIFGPVWDLDWAYGYEHSGNYCTTDVHIDFWYATQMEAVNFIRNLRKQTGQEVDKGVYRAWHDFMEGTALQETLDFIDDYFAYARPSFEHNATQWGGEGYGYASVANRMRLWIEDRANYVYDRLTPYDLDDDDENGIENLAAEGPDHDFGRVNVYNLGGLLLLRNVEMTSLANLPKGVYVVVNDSGRCRKIVNK